VDATVGGSVPKNFIPHVQKGLEDVMVKGAAGFPLVQLKAELYDGSYHAVDSDEMSFKMAANLAYKKCLELSAPVLLEPVGDLTVTVPEGGGGNYGAVFGDTLPFVGQEEVKAWVVSELETRFGIPPSGCRVSVTCAVEEECLTVSEVRIALRGGYVTENPHPIESRVTEVMGCPCYVTVEFSEP
jgi:hypothetical protein